MEPPCTIAVAYGGNLIQMLDDAVLLGSIKGVLHLHEGIAA